MGGLFGDFKFEEQVSGGSFDNCAAGDYDISGVEVVAKCLDDDENPVLMPSNNELKLLLRLTRQDGGTPPVYSVTPVQLIELVNAFKAIPPGMKSLEVTDPDISDKLAILVASINASGKTVSVHVKDGGWVGWLNDFGGPLGRYTVVCTGANRPGQWKDDGDYSWHTGNYTAADGRAFSAESILLNFKIVGDEFGNPTIFSGYALAQFMNNPFVVEGDFGAGKVSAYDTKRPLPNPKRVQDVAKWDAFWSFFIPSAAEGVVLEPDPLQSQYEVDEVANPQVWLINKAKADKREIVAWLKVRPGKGGRVYLEFDWDELAAWNRREVLTADQALEELMEYVTDRWANQELGDVDLDGVFTEPDAAGDVFFTELGKTWARLILNPVWIALNLPSGKKPPLNQLKPQQMDAILSKLKMLDPESAVDGGW